jgi:nucleotide-binding universal stress UspA family protein
VILICYDGSKAAQSAIAQAAHLMPGHPATVLTVWEPGLVHLAGVVPPAGEASADEAFEIARRCAEQGAELAHQAGIDATAKAIVDHTSIAEAILAAADRLHADAVIVGTRHQRGVLSHLVGSVTRTLAQLSSRPLLVVPCPGLAGAARRPAAASADPGR